MRRRLSASKTILVTAAILLFSHFTAIAKGFPKPKEEGYYIKTIIAKDIAPVYEKMSVTPIENCWLANDNLKAIYLYLSAEKCWFFLSSNRWRQRD